MKTIKIWTLACIDCAIENLHQPCEACPNYDNRPGSKK